jgi:fimbrial isopeptide formation D2 family protein/LPXTG-motif cell wall-anchored protein
MRGNNNRFRGRRVLAVLGAVSLGLVGAVAAAAPASADSGNIDFAKLGSIIIHKHVHQSGQTGSAAGGNLTSPGVENVRFTAYPIASLPLTDAASWTTLRTLTAPPTACDTPSLAGQTLGSGVVSPLTDSNGRATISSLPVAAYLLCETTTPSTVVDKAQPFIVTIPYSYNESWLYNVNVYPKNGVATVSKSVSQQTSLGLGATASFPVTTDIPTIADNANFTHYWVQDPMDARLTGATVATVTVDGTAVPSTYYSVATNGSNLVTLQFTNAGLTWLKSQGGKSVVTTFTGTVSSVGSGVINNTASFSAATRVGSVPTTPDTPVDPGNPNYPGSHSGAVTQRWGDLAVQKVDVGSPSTGLAGAVFEVYAAAAPYADTCTSTTITGSAISVNGATQFTSGSNGLLAIAGLFVSDSKNATVDADHRCYVLKEVAAPAGFITPQDAAALTAVSVKAGLTDTGVAYDTTITNTREQGVVLPMTGSSGIVVLSVAGLALIAAGAVLALLARKRSRQTA